MIDKVSQDISSWHVHDNVKMLKLKFYNSCLWEKEIMKRGGYKFRFLKSHLIYLRWKQYKKD